MGNCCTRPGETDQVMSMKGTSSKKKNIQLTIELSPKTNFPLPEVAKIVQKMNRASSIVEKKFKSLGVYTTRDTERTSPLQNSSKIYKYHGSGETYSGQYLFGERNGLGLETEEDGEIYSGNFKDDMRSGNGRLISANGDVYEGEFENGIPEGNGTLKEEKSGKEFRGEFKLGQKSGLGHETEANGDIYKGLFKSGQRNGRGELIFSNGCNYKGNFFKDRIHGYGEYEFNQKSEFVRYEGAFFNNVKYGKGKITFKNGNVYEGEFKRNQICGLGLMTVPGIGEYYGEFSHGKMNGTFTLFKKDGESLKQEFKDGVKVRDVK